MPILGKPKSSMLFTRDRLASASVNLSDQHVELIDDAVFKALAKKGTRGT